jgi:hypothetical protein
VALTDGAEALQQQLVSQFPEHTLVLDIIHATEYLWETATALLGETHPQRVAWVRAYLEPLLAGQIDAVITALEAEAKHPRCTATQRQAVRRTIGSYQRNRPYMCYDEYLARGWPIGTGVIEGASGHLVKDRMEQSGMRWTKAGAQAVLDLRARHQEIEASGNPLPARRAKVELRAMPSGLRPYPAPARRTPRCREKSATKTAYHPRVFQRGRTLAPFALVSGSLAEH